MQLAFQPGLLEMFEAKPQSKNEDYKKLWWLTHANNVALLIDGYQRLEPDSMIVDGESEYDEWDGMYRGVFKGNGKFFGMRHRVTGKPHGLVRFVRETGRIHECTCKLGELHGLSIYYSNDEVNVAMYKNG